MRPRLIVQQLYPPPPKPLPSRLVLGLTAVACVIGSFALIAGAEWLLFWWGLAP